MTRDEELKLVADTAAKVDTILKNLARVNEILDDMVAVLEIECLYPMEAIEITEHFIQIKITRADLECGWLVISIPFDKGENIGDLLKKFRLGHELYGFMKKRHQSLGLEKLPKMKKALPKIHTLRLLIRL